MPVGAPSVASARLVLRSVVCQRGERPLFAPLDLDVHDGDLVWLRGANGQGKTTLLRTIAGLAKPAAGTIAFADAAPRPLYLGHANALKDDLGAAEALAFLFELDGRVASAEAIDAALDRFGVATRGRLPVRVLSQGQRRRVALARLAAASTSDATPSLWLLDEPFDALDAAGVAVLGDVIAAHAARGGAIVATSHVPIEFATPRPRVVTLADA